MRARLRAALAAAFIASVAIGAEAAETFTARLEWVPIGGAERAEVAGEGVATAALDGATLAIEGSFRGLPAPITGAKLLQGVATGARGRAPPLGELATTGTTSGTLRGELRLTPEQVAALRAGQLYVLLYSEKGVAPDHDTLWGWLLGTEVARARR